VNPPVAVELIEPQPIPDVETARHDDLSMDLAAATLCQNVTRGIARIFTGGERGTRTFALGRSCAVARKLLDRNAQLRI
jgi:hypothetical protein